MLKQTETVCIRCGKVRVLLRQWKAKHEGKGTMVTSEESVCPDDACQEIVSQKFAAIRQLRESTEERRRNLVRRKRVKIAS